MGDTSHTAVVVITEAVLLALAAALTVISVFRNAGSLKLRLSRLPLLAVKCWSRSGEKGVVEEHIKGHMDDLRVKRARLVILFVTFCMALFGLQIMYNSVMDLPRDFTLAVDILYLTLQSLVTILVLRPSLIGPFASKIMYPVGMLILSICVAFDGHTLPRDGLFCFRLVFSVAVLDMRMVVICNAMYGLCSYWSYSKAASHFCRDVTPYAMHTFTSNEAFVSFTLILVVHFVERSLLNEVRQRLEVNATRNECGAVGSLLNEVCDVVVKLDASFTMKEDSPRLAALLLRDGRSLEGKQFQSFLQSEVDQRAFENFASRRPGTAEGMVGALRVRMRDSLGNGVEVELFHRQLEDMEGKSVHVVGIWEQQDVASAMPATVPSGVREQQDLASASSAAMVSQNYIDHLCAYAATAAFEPSLSNDSDTTSFSSDTGSVDPMDARSFVDLGGNHDVQRPPSTFTVL
mmetsp:Transcript_41598/g.114655  ORF Transcript_41598/g.114655 Transcript_41598/m.114655 type:complete len:462 (+) Transcript_41598:89-1474(+)